MSNENFTSANLSSSPPGVDDNSNTSNISSKNDVSNAATPANINNLGQNNVNKNKYTIEYCNNKTLHSSSPQLECKNFAKKLFQSPSDRHVYALVFSDSPVSTGRLPGQVKDLHKFARGSKLKLFNSETGLFVFTHRYGRDGRDTKKYEDSCLLFDYEFLQNLSSPQSVQHYKSCLATFIDLLNENATTDFSSFSTISDVRSFMVARMHTADPSVKIHLSFEHYCKSELGFGYGQKFSRTTGDSDIAVVMRYVFHDHVSEDDDEQNFYTTEHEDDPPKKKLKIPNTSLPPAAKKNVLQWSKIKLPAAMFGSYLEQDCEQFLADCLSLHTKQNQQKDTDKFSQQ